MARGIDYGNLMHQAMRGLIRDVLKDVAKNGLPGDHHFFITFDTSVEGVEIADWLRERYPAEITIVVQHWFDNLEVREDDFSITLNFGDQPEPLIIPYDALRTFVDPSVEFGLRFESHEDDDEDDEEDFDLQEEPPEEPSPRTGGAGSTGGAEVVSLDKFRKH